MKHFASPDFWALFNELPVEVQQLGRQNYQLLKDNPRETDAARFVARLPSLVRANLRRDSVPKRIDFTVNGDDIALIAVPKDVDLIPN